MSSLYGVQGEKQQRSLSSWLHGGGVYDSRWRSDWLGSYRGENVRPAISQMVITVWTDLLYSAVSSSMNHWYIVWSVLRNHIQHFNPLWSIIVLMHGAGKCHCFQWVWIILIMLSFLSVSPGVSTSGIPACLSSVYLSSTSLLHFFYTSSLLWNLIGQTGTVLHSQICIIFCPYNKNLGVLESRVCVYFSVYFTRRALGVFLECRSCCSLSALLTRLYTSCNS